MRSRARLTTWDHATGDSSDTLNLLRITRPSKVLDYCNSGFLKDRANGPPFGGLDLFRMGMVEWEGPVRRRNGAAGTTESGALLSSRDRYFPLFDLHAAYL